MLVELLLGVLSSALFEGGKATLKTLLTKPPVSKAISATAAEFPDVPSVSDSLKAWSQSDDFLNIVEAIQKDRGAYSDEQIAESFVQIGKFSHGLTTTFSTAQKVLTAFAKNLEQEIYRSDKGLLVEGRRAKRRHEEIREDLHEIAKELKQEIRATASLRAAVNQHHLLPPHGPSQEAGTSDINVLPAPYLSDAIVADKFKAQASLSDDARSSSPFQNKAPLPISDYVGRAALLKELKRKNPYRLVAIVGLLGVGKTTLLSELASRFGHESVFWFTFRPGLVSLNDLLLRLSRFIDSNKSETPNLETGIESVSLIQDKIDCVISELNRGTYKLIFDRVSLCSEDPAVESFLDILRDRLESGTIFVADRSKPPFISPVDENKETVRVVTLQGLTAREIRRFMSRRGINISATTARALATDLDGIPLALELLVALAGDNPSEEEIRRHASTAKSGMIEHLFDQVYRRLRETEVQVLTTASVFSLPFPKEQLLGIHRAITGTNALAGFDSLRRKSLIKEFGDDFFQLHELVSSLALAYLDTDLNTLRLRIGDELIHQMPDAITAHLEAALLYIKARELDKAADLATSMVAREFLLFHPTWTEQLVNVFNEKNVTAERWMWLLGDKGRISEFWHSFDEARTHYEAMLTLAKELNNKFAESIALQRLGNIYLDEDDDLAESYYRQSMSLKIDSGDLDGQAEIHNNLGLIYSDRRQFDQARAEYEQGLALREEIESEDWEKISLLSNLGILYARENDLVKARQYSELALQVSEDLGSPYHIAKSLYNLAKHDMVEGSVDAAKEKLTKVLDTVEGLDLWEIDDLAHTALGLTHYNANELESAISSFLKVAEIRERFDDEGQLAPIYFDLGTFNLKKSDTAAAFNFYLKGINLFEHISGESSIDLYAHNIYVLATKLKHHDLIKLIQALRTLKRRLPTGYAKARIYDTFGYIYTTCLENDRAAFIAWHCEIETFHEIHRFREKAVELVSLAAEYQNRGRYRGAIELNERALDVSNAHGFNDLVGTISFNTGNCFAKLEMLSEAEQLYRNALSHAKDNANAELERMVLHNLGEVLREQGEPEQASQLLQSSVEAARKAEDTEGVIHALNNLGLAFDELDRDEDALNSFNEAIRIAREHSHYDDLSNTLISLGNFYLERDAVKAKEAYEESLNAARSADNTYQEEAAMLSLAFAHRELGTFNAIEDDFKAVLEKANELNHNENLLKMITFAGEINFEEREIDAAAEMFEKALFFSVIVTAKTFKDLAPLPSGPFQVKSLTYALVHLLRVIEDSLKSDDEESAVSLYNGIRQKIATAEHWSNIAFLNQFLDAIGDYFTQKPSEELIDYVWNQWAQFEFQ